MNTGKKIPQRPGEEEEELDQKKPEDLPRRLSVPNLWYFWQKTSAAVQVCSFVSATVVV